jgi:phospholipid transport system substrate-binding protein
MPSQAAAHVQGRKIAMSFASIGRRRWLQSALAASAGMARPATADPAAIAPIRDLCNSLLEIMRAGHATPFTQRFNTLAPAIDRAFDLPSILQLSVGPPWANMPPAAQATLQTAFRRYTVANYVNNFDSYNGQRIDVQPDTKALPNAEQLVLTKVISAAGETHEIDYVMRQEGGGWRAVDVLADGSISRVAVQRSDFRRLVMQGGAQALIESLNQKTSDLSGGTLS